MRGACEGRVAIVTGGGRGIGREHALELARQGARVVVNDLGSTSDGSGVDSRPASSVVEEIVAAGGAATGNHDDVSDWQSAQRLIEQAVSEFGQLDVLVNNAGIVRDRTLVSMGEDEWDSVLRVHLRGTAAVTHFATVHWRAQAKKTGEPTNARLINTSSASGLFCNFGQSNYGAAKAALAAFTVIASKELASYGATANAIAPTALTRLTESFLPADLAKSMSPEHIAPLVAWLSSLDSALITGRVFLVGAGRIGVAEGWHLGPEVVKEDVWTVEELADAIPDLVAKAAANADMTGRVPVQTGNELV
jgi:NAD(P)-dependent dehydrogenase (short-subunit alcohol dehydrogenase family)